MDSKAELSPYPTGGSAKGREGEREEQALCCAGIPTNSATGDGDGEHDGVYGAPALLQRPARAERLLQACRARSDLQRHARIPGALRGGGQARAEAAAGHPHGGRAAPGQNGGASGREDGLLSQFPLPDREGEASDAGDSQGYPVGGAAQGGGAQDGEGGGRERGAPAAECGHLHAAAEARRPGQTDLRDSYFAGHCGRD